MGTYKISFTINTKSNILDTRRGIQLLLDKYLSGETISNIVIHANCNKNKEYL